LAQRLEAGVRREASPIDPVQASRGKGCGPRKPSSRPLRLVAGVCASARTRAHAPGNLGQAPSLIGAEVGRFRVCVRPRQVAGPADGVSPVDIDVASAFDAALPGTREAPRPAGLSCALGQGPTVNRDIIEGNWTHFKGVVRETWGKLRNDWRDVSAGKQEQLMGGLQETFGILRDQADEQQKSVDRIADSMARPTKASPPERAKPAATA
jgi:uncharacterized protein YjbJ (UPF0337 family)